MNAKKKQIKICMHTGIPIYTYADILIFIYMYRNNIHKCIHTRPTVQICSLIKLI